MKELRCNEVSDDVDPTRSLVSHNVVVSIVPDVNLSSGHRLEEVDSHIEPFVTLVRVECLGADLDEFLRWVVGLFIFLRWPALVGSGTPRDKCPLCDISRSLSDVTTFVAKCIIECFGRCLEFLTTPIGPLTVSSLDFVDAVNRVVGDTLIK